MGYFNCIVFLLVLLWLVYQTKEPLCQLLPMEVSGYMLLLFVLAFFRHLSWMDGISVVLLIGLGIWIYIQQKNQKVGWWKEFLAPLGEGSTWMVLLTIVLVSVLAKDRIALWWDDINFWATDVKSIYFLDGFAGKYGNVAPEFGDYPPATQLIKWWFLHLSPQKFQEGLMFSGYYTLLVIFLAPLWGQIKGKNPIPYLLGALGLVLTPSVMETFYLEGCSADLPMGLAYGYFLWSVVDTKKHTKGFYYGRLSLALSFAVLCKSVGMEWVIFGAIFLIGWSAFQSGKEKKAYPWKEILGTLLLPCLVEGTWLLSCLLKRRVAKLTGAGLKMVVSASIPDTGYGKEMLKAFVQGFALTPIHREKTVVFDLSVIALLGIYIILFMLCKKEKIWTKGESRFFACFFGFTALITYGLTLLAHFTIFAGETQYLIPTVMTASIERYGVPFTMGCWYFFFGILLTKWDRKNAFVLMALLVFLCSHYSGVYHAFWGYRQTLETDKIERESFYDKEAQQFGASIGEVWKDGKSRILYLRDGSSAHWVRDSYTSFFVSPAAVVYGNAGREFDAYLQETIVNSHASYLYVDPLDSPPDQFLQDHCEEEFAYGQLYEICSPENDLTLRKVSNIAYK